MKKIPEFLDDRDKTVREEGKSMVIEIYRWIGAPLKSQLNMLKPVLITELETEFNNLQTNNVAPTRFLRSQPSKGLTNNGSGREGEADEGNFLTNYLIISRD